jgi:hypothetical protein
MCTANQSATDWSELTNESLLWVSGTLTPAKHNSIRPQNSVKEYAVASEEEYSMVEGESNCGVR